MSTTFSWAERASSPDGYVRRAASELPAKKQDPTPAEAQKPRGSFTAKRKNANGAAADGPASGDQWSGFENKKPTQLQETNARMERLEADLTENQRRIEKLESQLTDKDKENAALQRRLQVTEVYVQQLRDDVGEQRLQVKCLENMLAGDSKRIQELELQIQGPQLGRDVLNSDPPAAWDDIKTNPDSSSEGGVPVPDELKQKPAEGSDHEVILLPDTVEEPAAKSPERKVASPPPSNDSAFVSRPPVLNIAIKNGGRIVTKAEATEDWTEHLTSHPGSWSAGSTTKDIRDMSLSERTRLFGGPTITVLIGKQPVRNVPKRMFMYLSPTVNTFFQENRQATYMALPERSIAVPVMDLLNEWMTDMVSNPKTWSLKIRENPLVDLAVRRDCAYLGMGQYVRHFTRKYCDKVRDGFPGYDMITQIEKNTADDDALWVCLANNLANLRVRRTIPNPAQFDAYLIQHPRLAQAIGRIETRLKSPSKKKSNETPKSGSVSETSGNDKVGKGISKSAPASEGTKSNGWGTSSTYTISPFTS
jgi:hypothetical protein